MSATRDAEIVRRRRQGETARSIAKDIGVSATCIAIVVRKKAPDLVGVQPRRLDTKGRILVVLECVSYDVSEDLIAALAAKSPLDKAPWVASETYGWRLKQAATHDVRALRAAVVREIRKLVRAGRVVETEPGRYALAERGRG